MAPLVTDIKSTQIMVEKTIEIAGHLLSYVTTGENPFHTEQAETVVSEEPEEEIFGVLEAGE